MSSLVIDLCDSDEDGADHSSPALPSAYEQNEVFEKKVLQFFKDFPLVKRSSSDAEMNELLVANCNTLTNMKKNVFPDVMSFIDAAGLRIEESLDGFFAKSGACQFASIAYHLYNKSFEHNFRPDLVLREMAVNVIAANQHEYQQYLEPAVVHLRTRSTKKAGGQSINIQDYLGSMRKPVVDGDSVTLQALADFFKFKVRVLKWSNGKPVVLTTASSPERQIKTPFIKFGYDPIESSYTCPERVIFLILRNNHYQCLVPKQLPSSSQTAGNGGVDESTALPPIESDCCPICLDDIHEWNGSKLDCCKHTYHTFCIIEESKRSTKCPQCRRAFKTITRLAKDNSNRIWHMQCKKVSREDEASIDNVNDFVNGISSYDEDDAEIDFDQIKCKVCNRGDREDVLIECDSHTCSNWAHIDCVSLESVPDATMNEFWYCGECGLISNLSNTIESALRRRAEEDEHNTYISLLEDMQSGSSGGSNASTIESAQRALSSSSARRRPRRRYEADEISDLRRSIVNENDDEKAIDCIKSNFIKAATRLSTVEAAQDSSRKNESPCPTDTTSMNNSEAFLWQQMRLAEEAAACSGNVSKKSVKRGSKNASKKNKKSRFGSENVRSRPKRDEHDRFRSSSVGKSVALSRTVELSTGSSSASSSSSCSVSDRAVSSRIVKKRKRPRLRNRFQNNKQQQKARNECKALVDEVFRVSRISVDGLSRANSSFRRQYEIDLGSVTFKLMQSLQNKSSVRILLDNNIMLALGKILAPKIDANGNTIIPHFHCRRRIFQFLSAIEVRGEDLKSIGNLVRALVFYSTYGNRRNRQTQQLNKHAKDIVEKWRRIVRAE